MGSDQSDSESTTNEHVARKPYVTPRLTRLGSVRELTFGASGTNKDGLGLFKKTKDGF